MSLKEFMDKVAGDYSGVMARLGSEAVAVRIVGMFKKDSSLESLESAYKEGDHAEIFNVTHNLKGVCANLGLTKLGEYSSELCEATRHGAPTVDIAPMMDNIRSLYTLTKEALEELA